VDSSKEGQGSEMGKNEKIIISNNSFIFIKMLWIVCGFLVGTNISLVILPVILYFNVFDMFGARKLIYPKQIMFLSIPPAICTTIGWIIEYLKMGKNE